MSSARDPRDLKQFLQSYIEMIEGRKKWCFHVSDKSPGSYPSAAPLFEAVGVEAASIVWLLSWTHHTPLSALHRVQLSHQPCLGIWSTGMCNPYATSWSDLKSLRKPCWFLVSLFGGFALP